MATAPGAPDQAASAPCAALKELRLDTLAATDVTADFFDATSEIPFGHVVKAPDFRLLHGTHALEVLNAKLDTSLLETAQFDPDSVTTLPQVYSIIESLFGALAAWLDNNSLGVSVFSCWYVEKILTNYARHGKQNLSFKASPELYMPIMELDLDSLPSGTDFPVDVLLRTFVVALLQFVKFILRLGMAGVVYEEEDLNTQTMDANVLVTVQPDDTLNELAKIIDWIDSKQTSDDLSPASAYLRLVRHMLQIPSFLEISQPDPFHESDQIDEREKVCCDAALDLLNGLDTTTSRSDPTTPGCFSTNVQKRFSNSTPPKPVVIADFKAAAASFVKMFADLKEILNVTRCRDSIQLTECLNYLMCRREPPAEDDTDSVDIDGLHIVVRASLQLFLMREDEGILGSKTYNIGTYLFDYMCRISVQDAKVLTVEDPAVRAELQKLVTDLKVPFYNFLTSVSQNPARQRQFANKEIIYWDKYQVDSETFESSINNEYPDNLGTTAESGGASFPVLPVASFVYFAKLVRMVQVMLKSCELHLCRDLRQLNTCYWLTSYLTDYLIQHLNRLLDVTRLRRAQLVSLHKKIKKARGDKKLRLKKELEDRKQHAADVVRSEQYLQYLVSKHTVYRNMIEIKLVTLQVLMYYGYVKLPKLCKAPERLLFGLQLKPFQSIGVPQLPSFDDYTTAMAKFTDAFGEVVKKDDFPYFKNLIKAKSAKLNESFKTVERQLQELNLPKFLHDYASADFKLLRLSSIKAGVTLNRLTQIAQAGKAVGPDSPLNPSIVRGSHQYFPEILLDS